MRTKFTALALGAAMAAGFAAAPASAQYGYPGDRGLMQRFNAQIGQTEQRIERLAQRRAISGSEYNALREHSRELRQRLYRFARNGLDRGEVQDISDRIDNLRDRIRDERRDGHRNGW
ncbi:MAG TPA: hypothetical protein VGC46_08325 [Allosphingosinicella sp.]